VIAVEWVRFDNRAMLETSGNVAETVSHTAEAWEIWRSGLDMKRCVSGLRNAVAAAEISVVVAE